MRGWSGAGVACALATALATALVTASSCGRPAAPPESPPPPPLPSDAERIALFEKGVETVTEGVHVAIGYGLANVVMLEGAGGVVIVDATESRGRAEEVLAAFREITDKPVQALILTHNHADHVFGGLVFTEGREDIPVYAHAATSHHIDEVVSVISHATFVRSMRQFGQLLPPGHAPHAGIGLDLDYRPEEMALARPTHTFEERLDLEIAGIRMELIHAPGETPDQVVVWLPDKRVLLAADNIYEAFPNLYAIRGTAYRDVMLWVASLDTMRALGAEILVPGHTRPVYGAEAVMDTLTAYRDAIQFVHDQTVRGMNHGKTPDELAASLRLPPHLEQHPWLQPHYGTVGWSVRAIYAGYMGWFDGEASTLEPLAPLERSQRFADALAANQPLPVQARGALERGDYAWAAELAAHWRRLEPDNPDAAEVLAESYEALARAHPSANGRNYYRTQAAEVRGEIVIAPADRAAVPEAFIESLPIERFMMAMPVRLKAEEVLDLDQAAQFRFTDIGEDYTIHIRRGVAEVRRGAHPSPDVTVTTTSTTWKRLATGRLNPVQAVVTRAIRIDGGALALSRFLGHFERD